MGSSSSAKDGPTRLRIGRVHEPHVRRLKHWLFEGSNPGSTYYLYDNQWN
jgi:hypothetical protein